MLTEETMKMRLLLISLFMLLSFPLEAKQVYVAILTADETRVKNLDELDELIRKYNHDIDYYFSAPRVKDFKLILEPDQELVIRGGRGSIKEEIDKMKYIDTALIEMSGRYEMGIFACYVTRPLGRENTTYVMIKAVSVWKGLGFCDRKIYGRLFPLPPTEIARRVKAAIQVPEKDAIGEIQSQFSLGK
jgi:hypothetical protein